MIIWPGAGPPLRTIGDVARLQKHKWPFPSWFLPSSSTDHRVVSNFVKMLALLGCILEAADRWKQTCIAHAKHWSEPPSTACHVHTAFLCGCCLEPRTVGRELSETCSVCPNLSPSLSLLQRFNESLKTRITKTSFQANFMGSNLPYSAGFVGFVP